MCEILLLIACISCVVMGFVIYHQKLDIQRLNSSYCKPFFEDEKKPFEKNRYKDTDLNDLLDVVDGLLKSYRPINESLAIQLCKKLAKKDIDLDKFFKETDIFDYEKASQTFEQIIQKVKHDI